VKAVALATRRITDRHAVAVENVSARDAASGMLFITPWNGRSLIGCAYTWDGADPSGFEATDADVDGLLQAVNASYPTAGLSRQDVLSAHVGLLPADESAEASGAPELATHHRIIDHGHFTGPDGLVSVIGVKFTTARAVTEQAIDQLWPKLDKLFVRSMSAVTPLYGGAMPRIDVLANEMAAHPPHGLDAAAARRLVYRHGSAAAEVLAVIEHEPAMREPVHAGCEVLRAEVIHAVRAEAAVRLADVIFRRTSLGLAGQADAPCVEACSRLMASELQWDEPFRLQEVAAVRGRLARFDMPAASPARMAHR
jgi:glycerol-3-phosphate dehydrogenase